MYVLLKVLFLKYVKTKDHVRNVRKWPNLCSINLGIFFRKVSQAVFRADQLTFKLVEKFWTG